MSKIPIAKIPALDVQQESTEYKGLTQSELLHKVKLLHEQMLKTNKYLADVHRISIYNWDVNDTGNIMVELPSSKKGFLLDSILRLRGTWNAETNSPELKDNQPELAGWIYKVTSNNNTERFGLGWKDKDYLMYDENGKITNVQADIMGSLFTPIIPESSETISLTVQTDMEAKIQRIRADLKIDPSVDNDIVIKEGGIYSDVFSRVNDLYRVQHEAPTGPNTTGAFIVVFLEEAPDEYFPGYLYLIPTSDIVEIPT